MYVSHETLSLLEGMGSRVVSYLQSLRRLQSATSKEGPPAAAAPSHAASQHTCKYDSMFCPFRAGILIPASDLSYTLKSQGNIPLEDI